MKRFVMLSAALAAAALVVGCGVSSPDSVVSAGELMTSPAGISADAGAGDEAAGDETAVDETAGGGDAEGETAGGGDADPTELVTDGDAPAGSLDRVESGSEDVSAPAEVPAASADSTEPAGPSTQNISPTESSKSATSKKASKSSAKPAESSKTASKPPAGSSISPAKAGALAAAAHAGSRVTEIELDRAHGTTVWEITVVSADGRWQVDVELATGAVLGDRADRTDELGKYLDRLAGAKLDHAAALTTILGLHEGSRLAELELDTDDGRVVWEADIVTGAHQKYEVRIDAASGKVLKNKLDD